MGRSVFPLALRSRCPDGPPSAAARRSSLRRAWRSPSDAPEDGIGGVLGALPGSPAAHVPSGSEAPDSSPAGGDAMLPVVLEGGSRFRTIPSSPCRGFAFGAVIARGNEPVEEVEAHRPLISPEETNPCAHGARW